MTRASVIIAVRNDPAGISATLGALSAQTLPADAFEVIVVDDASSDDTAAVAGTYPGVRLITLPRPCGAYIARNRALEIAGGEVIAITDADCRPDPRWLERGMARLADDQDIVVAGHIAMPLGARPSVAAMVDVVHHLDQERYVTAGGAVTANLMAGAGTFRAVGGFNEQLRSSGDMEWTGRAVRAGHRLVYAPEVVVTHPPRASARELWRKARRVAEGGRAASRQGILTTIPPYRNPLLFVPRHRRRGLERVRQNGASPGPLRWLLVGLAQLALVQLPQAVFALLADLRASLEGSRR